VVSDRCRGADLVVLEDFAFGAAFKAHEIGAMGFMVRHKLWRLFLPYCPVAPATLKKWTTGHGNSPKDLMIKSVFQRWGHDVDDNNCADAIGLAYIGLALTGSWLPTIDPQREVVRDLWKKYAAILEPWRGRTPASSVALLDGTEPF
jgi:crossover junction endodeoxyribonuclease RuvC